MAHIEARGKSRQALTCGEKGREERGKGKDKSENKSYLRGRRLRWSVKREKIKVKNNMTLEP